MSPHDTVVPWVNKLFALNNWRRTTVPGANVFCLIAIGSSHNDRCNCTGEQAHPLYVDWDIRHRSSRFHMHYPSIILDHSKCYKNIVTCFKAGIV
jgi:hypothetical protein